MPWVAFVACQRPKEAPGQVRGDLELLPQELQVLIEPTREGQQVIALVLQLPTDRLDPMRAKGRAGPQLGHHEVVHHAAVGVARPGHGQNVMAEPVHQQGDVIGQGDRLIARRAGPAQVLGRTGRRLAAASPVVPPKAVALFLVVLLGLQGAKGAIVKESDQGLQVADDVEDIASTGDLGQGQALAGTEAAAGVGDGGLGIEALVDQLQEAHTPGIGVAMILQAEQIAIHRRGIDAHEHRVAGLKDFVVSPRASAHL